MVTGDEDDRTVGQAIVPAAGFQPARDLHAFTGLAGDERRPFAQTPAA